MLRIAPQVTRTEEDGFEFWVPLEKAAENAGGDRILRGIASTEDEDLHGEVVLQNGLNIDYLKSRGFVNWEHGKGPVNYIGEPIDAKITSKGLFIEARLYKGKDAPEAEEAWKLAKTLEANHSKRKLGFSIQGKVLEKRGNQIIKANVHHVALTPQPVNPRTYADIAKSFAAEEEDEVSTSGVAELGFSTADLVFNVTSLLKSETHNADGSTTREFHPIALISIGKALSAGAGTDSATMTGGRATISEDLEGGKKSKKEKKEKDAKGNTLVDGGLKVATFKSLELDEDRAFSIIRKAFPEATDKHCRKIIEIANKQE